MKKIVNEYIDYTKKAIKKYMKIIFESKYDVITVEEFLKTYINVRYYNVCSSNQKKKSFYIKIIEEINVKYRYLLNKFDEKAKKEKITIDIREEKHNILKAYKDAFLLLIYWDNVLKDDIPDNLLKNSVNKAGSIRSRYLKIKDNEQMKKELYSVIKNDLINKEIYLDNLKSDVFHLKLKRHRKKVNMYYVDVENKIRFPAIYSDIIIKKVMNEDIIQEDIMEVEYTLLSVIIIQDLVKGSFKDFYITKLPETLFGKKQKLYSVLNNINTQILQDKILTKITYTDYLSHTAIIHKCINSGYKFVIELDKSFVNIEELEKLQLFKYILVTKNTKLYKEIIQCDKYNNILEK